MYVYMRQTDQADDSTTPSTIATTAYEYAQSVKPSNMVNVCLLFLPSSTLSKHHAWLVRKTVQVALYAVPSSQVMNQRMFDQDTRIPGLLGYVCLLLHSFFSLSVVFT